MCIRDSDKAGQPEPDIGVQEKAEKDKLLDELMGKPIQKEENAQNPSVAKMCIRDRQYAPCPQGRCGQDF